MEDPFIFRLVPNHWHFPSKSKAGQRFCSVNPLHQFFRQMDYIMQLWSEKLLLLETLNCSTFSNSRELFAQFQLALHYTSQLYLNCVGWLTETPTSMCLLSFKSCIHYMRSYEWQRSNRASIVFLFQMCQNLRTVWCVLSWELLSNSSVLCCQVGLCCLTESQPGICFKLSVVLLLSKLHLSLLLLWLQK